jgi:hypothetical protein
MPGFEPMPAAPGHDNIYDARLRISERFEIILLNRFKRAALIDLASRRGLLGVSVKNTRFSIKLIDAFIRFCNDHLASGLVTIVDRPYECNVRAAGRGCTWESVEIDKLWHIAAEKRRSLIRALAKQRTGGIELVDWDALAKMTPEWLVEEIRAAWDRRGLFHQDVLAHTRERFPDAKHALEGYAEFVLHELPVLLHLYYFGYEQVVDFYPGPQPPLFWKLESGAYAEDLPKLNLTLMPREGLVYAHAIDLQDERDIRLTTHVDNGAAG